MQAQGVEAHITIGGWAGSLYFSSNLATAANRTAFVKTVVDFASNYTIDGVQFEYDSCESYLTLLTSAVSQLGVPQQSGSRLQHD